MKLMGGSRRKSGRRFVLLAPPHDRPKHAGTVVADASMHQRYLEGAQRLRGKVYTEDGAIGPGDLDQEGRHIQPADDLSWHLLTVDDCDRVVACLRYFAHLPGVEFDELAVSQSTVSQSACLGATVREGIETELRAARRRGFSYVELGGWAISQKLRYTSEALNTLIAVYALSQMLGGARGLSTATTRHHSSSILKRIGGTPLRSGGVEIPPYYDPQYKCDMELLRFDSASPNPRYAGWIKECCAALGQVPVVVSDGSAEFSNDLRHLQLALVADEPKFAKTAIAGHPAFTPA